MHAVLGDGMKLQPPFVIFKQKNLTKEELPSGFIFCCQEKGWLNLLQTRLRLSEITDEEHSFKNKLVLDTFIVRLTPVVKNNIQKANTDLVIIAGGMTSQLQVLDLVVNKPTQ